MNIACSRFNRHLSGLWGVFRGLGVYSWLVPDPPSRSGAARVFSWHGETPHVGVVLNQQNSHQPKLRVALSYENEMRLRTGAASLAVFKVMKRRTAFTLVELLVVIAIIAVVAAILFPVFASAKRSAKRTTALSNVEQIGKAVQLYLNDNDDTLPFRTPSLPSWPGFGDVLIIDSDLSKGFSEMLGPYLSSTAVWYSPEDRLTAPGYTSFCVNGQLAYSWSMSGFARPAEAIYLTDRTDIGRSPAPPPDTYAWWSFIDTEPFTVNKLPGNIDPVSVAVRIDPIRYLGNTALYLFLDSHAQSMVFYRTWGNSTQNLHLATKS